VALSGASGKFQAKILFLRHFIQTYVLKKMYQKKKKGIRIAAGRSDNELIV